MSGAHPNNGGRSAGVAYVDLAVGDSQALVAGVAKAGQTAAEAFMRVFQEAFRPAGISDELANEIVGGATQAAKQAVQEVNDALKGIGYEQLSLFDTSALVDQAAKAGSEAAKALTSPIEEGAAEAGKAAGTSVGDGVAQGAEEGSKRAGESVRQNVSEGARQAGEESKSRILGALDELKHGITYSIGGWGIGYSVGNAIYSGFSNAFGAIKDTIFGFNSEVQQAQIALTTMLGSPQAADSFDKRLQDFAVKTPFEYSTLVPDAQKMMALGVGGPDQVLKTLTAIGDAVSSLGGSPATLEETVNAISEMASKGQVMEVNLRQLEIRGIPALKILADEFGVTTVQMQGMIRKGQVMSEDAIPKLVDGIEHGTKSTHALGGEMALQAGTFQGSLSNIHDALQQFGGEAFKPVFDVFNRLAVETANWLGSDHNALLATIKSDTQDFVNGGESFVKGAIRLGDIATSGLSKPIEGLIKPIFDDLKRGAPVIESMLPKLAQDFNDIAKALLNVGRDVGLEVWHGLTTAASVAVPLFKDLADALAAVARNQTVVTVAKDLLEVFIGYKVVSWLTGFVGDLATNIGSKLVPALMVWKTAQVEATTAMTAVGGGATTLGTALAGIQGAGKGAALGIGTLLSGISPMTIAISAGTILLGAFINAHQKAAETERLHTDSVKNLSDAISKNNGIVTTDVYQQAAQNALKQGAIQITDRLGLSTEQVVRAYTQGAPALNQLRNNLDSYIESQQKQMALDPQHSSMYTKHIKDARDLSSILGDEASAWSKNREAADLAARALGMVDANGKTLSQSDQDLIGKLEDLRKGNLNAAEASDTLKAAQDRLNGNKISLLEADQNLAQSKLNLTQALKDNGRAFDQNSQAGLNDRAALKSALDNLKNYYDTQVAAKGPSDALTKSYKDQVQQLIDQVPNIGQNKDLIGQLTQAYKNIPDAITTDLVLRGYKDADGQISALGKSIAGLVSNFGIDTQTAINLITSGLNQSGPHDVAARRALNHAAGGPIHGPGTGTSDSIPAMLSNGEHVWTAKEVKAAGGHHAVESLRKSVLQGFAAGGPVHRRVRHAVHLAHGVHHAFGAHHNVHAHHRAVHVAHPGARHPRHPLGYHPRPHAHHPRPNAHVPHHAARHVKHFAQGGPVLGVNTSFDVTQMPAYQFAHGVFENLSNSLEGMSSAAGGGQLGAWIAAGLAAAGVPMSWADGMRTLIGRESGGNPRAINLTDANALAGHPSMGIAQTIMPTFEAYRVPWLPDDPYNPVADIAASARYIRATYGDISNVQQANPNLPPMGYDNGGMLMPGRPGMNFSNKPEPVFSSTQWSKIDKLIARGVDAASSKPTVVHVYFDGKLVDDRVEIKVEEAFDDLSLALSGGRRP